MPQADGDDATPYYPIEIPRHLERMATLTQRLGELYPNLSLMGRLGSYRYLDMYQAVEQGLALVERQWKK